MTGEPTIEPRQESSRTALRIAVLSVVAALALVLLLFSLRTTDHLTVFGTELGLWHDAHTHQPDDAEVVHNLGLALDRNGQYAAAIDQYERTLTLRPGYVAARNNLANSLIRVGRRDEAIARFEEVLAADPKFTMAHYNLGSLLVDIDHNDEGIAHLEAALALRPKFVEAHNNLGLALVKTGRPEEAFPHFEEALRCRPCFTEACIGLATAAALTARRRQAIDAAQRAIGLARNEQKTDLADQVEAWLVQYRGSQADALPAGSDAPGIRPAAAPSLPSAP